MPAGTLSGEVYKRINGKWKLVLTASGIPVIDNWQMPRDWREETFATAHKPRVTFHTDAAAFRLDAYLAQSYRSAIRFPYSGA